MSKAGLAYQKDQNLGFLKKTWEKIDNFYCSEHRHEILSFDKGTYQVNFLNEIDYSRFEYEASNYHKTTSIAVGVVGGAIVLGPAYYFGAPAIASWLGANGFLGATSTSTVTSVTQISSLSGAALESASLAKIGFGALSVNGLGMAGGTVIIGGVGSGLGGYAGASTAADYFKTIEDFEYVTLKDGGDKEVIFINGLFSQKDRLFTSWKNQIEDKYENVSFTGLRWESNALSKLAELELGDLSNVIKKLPKKLGMILARLTKMNNLTGILGFFGLVNNIWFVTYYRAALTGYILADNIARLHKGHKIDLYGHSLGARVIFYALQVLSTKKEVFIENVYLFGGAQERKDDSGWLNATKAVSGKVYNVYSSNDKVLKILYQGGTLGSSPIGLKPITFESQKVLNIDASDWISGHSAYHENLSLLLNEIEKKEKAISKIQNSNTNDHRLKVIFAVIFIFLTIVSILIFTW